MEKGPHTDNPGAAIVVGDEGVTNNTPEIIIENNMFTNRMDRSTVFVRNLTATGASLRANRIVGNIDPLAGPGTDVARRVGETVGGDPF